MRRRHCAWGLVAAGLLAFQPGAAAARCQPERPPLLVLDAGHSLAKPGAMSVTGMGEVVYNDRLAAELAAAFRQAGWQVHLTRPQPEDSPSLTERATLANQAGADVLLSVHHDSAQLKYLREVQTPNGQGYETTQPIRGYSVFVSGLNARFADSRRFAEGLGQELLALGRPPTLHHAEPIAGEGRPLLNAETGVYQFDQLAVLRLAAVPAVLLEAGVIVDAGDEAYVSDPAKRQALVDAVVRAAQQYCAGEGVGKSTAKGGRSPS